jgi:hypothetical protein
MATHLPGHGWQDFKHELMNKWHELTEHELESTHGNVKSIADLLEKKVGAPIERVSERLEEMASHYHLYDEPEEKTMAVPKDQSEKVMELSPKIPSDIDPKPKDNFKD